MTRRNQATHRRLQLCTCYYTPGNGCFANIISQTWGLLSQVIVKSFDEEPERIVSDQMIMARAYSVLWTHSIISLIIRHMFRSTRDYERSSDCHWTRVSIKWRHSQNFAIIVAAIRLEAETCREMTKPTKARTRNGMFTKCAPILGTAVILEIFVCD